MIKGIQKIVVILTLVQTGATSRNVLVYSQTAHKYRVESDLRAVEGAAISPDGSSVAIYISAPSFGRIEVHDLRSSRISFASELPRITDRWGNWSYPASRVRYCDNGKYILIYAGEGTSFVVDTQDSRIVSTLTLDARLGQTGRPKEPKLIVASCAARGNIAAYTIVTLSDEVRVTELFSLDTGEQLGVISQGVMPAAALGLDISPSGTHALTYDSCIPDTICRGPAAQRIAILDLQFKTITRWIDPALTVGQAAFVGEFYVALAADDAGSSGRRVVKIFDIRTGALVRVIGDVKHSAFAFVTASADGQYLFAYTGQEEDHCDTCSVGFQNMLQIRSARFTVWNLESGKIVADSPRIRTKRIHSDLFFDSGHFHGNSRPWFQFSQSGNAVLVTHTQDQSAIDVFSLK